jgi:tetratricopeptide (TPR) repeat protein
VSLGFPSALHAVPNDEIARAYFAQAQRLLEADNREAALQLLEVAKEFDSGQSDIFYLEGRLLAERQERTRQALEAYRAALSRDRWRTFSRREGLIALSELLLRTDRHQDALRRLENVTDTARADTDLSYVRIRALFGAGRRADASELLERALERHAEDARFLALAIRENELPGLRETELLRERRSQDPAYRKAVLAFVRNARDPRLVQEWVQTYWDVGGVDPLAAVRALEAAAEREAASVSLSEALRRFRDGGGMEERWLLRRLADALSALEGDSDAASGELSELRDRMGGLTARLIDDRNRDGFSEHAYRFEDGALRRWSVDRDQDGVAEFVIHFDSEGGANRVEFGGGERTLRYGRYPNVASVAFESARYALIPGRFAFPLLRSGSDWRNARIGPLEQISLNETIPLLSEEQVRDLSYERIVVRDSEAPPEAVERLSEGVVVRRAEDRNADGTADYVIEFADGQRQVAIRDMDFDGFFEATERYSDGSIRVLTVDSDDDGRVNFTQSFGADGELNWDLDQDGSPDLEFVRRQRSAVLEHLPGGEQTGTAPDMAELRKHWEAALRSGE